MQLKATELLRVAKSSPRVSGFLALRKEDKCVCLALLSDFREEC